MVLTRSQKNADNTTKLARSKLIELQRICDSNLLGEQEIASINSVSFTPTREEIIQLCGRERDAQCAIEKRNRGPILSKLHFLSILDANGNERNLLPESLDPMDTVLTRLGREAIKEYPESIASSGFAFIPDRNMTFGGGSCGPNGVLVDCHDKFGKNRINLFRENPDETLKLLESYLSFRNENEKMLFDLFIKHINRDAFTKDFKIDPEKEATLPVDLRHLYLLTVSLFNKINTIISSCEKTSLDDCGIGCVSFCQTWMRNGHNVEDAQFSVCSPHFQTRFYVNNTARLQKCGVTLDEMEGYSEMIKYFDQTMSKDYGIGGGGQAFINLDNLLLAFENLDLQPIQSPRLHHDNLNLDTSIRPAEKVAIQYEEHFNRMKKNNGGSSWCCIN